MASTLSKRLAFVLSLLAAFILWQLAAVRVNAPLILPSPVDVFRCIGENVRDPLFLMSFGASCLRVLFAIALVLAAGSLCGLCSGLSGVFRSFIAFPLAFIRAVPVVAIILLSVFWLGSSALPVFVALLMSLPVMVDSVAGGITKIPPRLLDAAKVYGFSKRKLLFHVYLPAVAPNFFFGCADGVRLELESRRRGRSLGTAAFRRGHAVIYRESALRDGASVRHRHFDGRRLLLP